MPARPPLAPLLALAGLVGCTGGPSRGAWMREVLVDADRAFLSRDPARVADKYARMSLDPYAFLRGTLPWYYAQVARADPDRDPTAFLTVPAATAVLLVGDPHPENLSTQQAWGEPGQPLPAPGVEFIDLDAASWGPWLLDVRRAATGVRALGDHSGGCDAACQGAAAEALVAAYGATVEGADDDLSGVILADLLDEAAEEGAEQRRTSQRTRWVDPRSGAEVEEGQPGAVRVLRTSLEVEADGKGLRPLTRAEAHLLDDVLVALTPRLPAGFRVLDAARREGAGVSSLPAIRFALLFDLGDDGPDDDGLLNLREILDPPAAVPGRATYSPGTFSDNAHRLGFASARLWARPDSDPLRAEACLGRQCFKALSWTSWFQDIERDDVAEEMEEGDLEAGDLIDLGHDIGVILAREHLRGARADGGDPAAAIRDDLRAGGGAGALADEVVAVSGRDHEQLLRDAQLFGDLLEQHGPLLGADVRVEHHP